MPQRHAHGDGRDDEGQAVPFGAMVLAIGVAATFALAGLAGDAIDAARARSAADGSALAGVTGGRAAAERLAAVNGGRIVGFSVAADGSGSTVVTVTVRVGDASATAAAAGG